MRINLYNADDFGWTCRRDGGHLCEDEYYSGPTRYWNCTKNISDPHHYEEWGSHSSNPLRIPVWKTPYLAVELTVTPSVKQFGKYKVSWYDYNVALSYGHNVSWQPRYELDDLPKWKKRGFVGSVHSVSEALRRVEALDYKPAIDRIKAKAYDRARTSCVYRVKKGNGAVEYEPFLTFFNITHISSCYNGDEWGVGNYIVVSPEGKASNLFFSGISSSGGGYAWPLPRWTEDGKREAV